MDGTRGSDQALDTAGHGDRVRGPHSVYRIAWALFVLPSPNPSLFLMFFFAETNTLKALFSFTYPEWILGCEAVASKYMVLVTVLWFTYIYNLYSFIWLGLRCCGGFSLVAASGGYHLVVGVLLR